MIKYSYVFILLFFGFIGISSCVKDKGDYLFENEENVYLGPTIDYLKSKVGVYDSLLLVFDLLPVYKEDLTAGNITVFTPTNTSFELALLNLNLTRLKQGKPQLSLAKVDLAQLDTLLSRYVLKDIVNTDTVFYVDGLYVNTLRFEEENKGLMHAQRIKQPSSGFVEGGLVRLFYSDTNRSTFVNQWIRTGTQAVNIRTNDGLVHILSTNHEFGFGEFLDRMNK